MTERKKHDDMNQQKTKPEYNFRWKCIRSIMTACLMTWISHRHILRTLNSSLTDSKILHLTCAMVIITWSWTKTTSSNWIRGAREQIWINKTIEKLMFNDIAESNRNNLFIISFYILCCDSHFEHICRMDQR